MHTIDLSGKTALVTGGTRNIGRAIAQRLAEAGADLILLYRRDDATALRAQDELREHTGRRVHAYKLDVEDEAAVEATIPHLCDDFPHPVSILVHNATRHDSGGIMPALRTQQWRDAFSVNLDAAFYLTRALLRHEGALPTGSSIVFISSGRGHGPAAGHAPYGSAKAGLNHFGAMLAQDVGPRGVRVNVVSPGYVHTAESGATEEEKRLIASGTALRRLCVPVNVADAVLFFASDLSAFVTGQTLQVNGGG